MWLMSSIETLAFITIVGLMVIAALVGGMI
jgi:hypothetical protein